MSATSTTAQLVLPAPPLRCSFEEFRLYFESAEKTTDRRLQLIRWCYSVAAAILVAEALILDWTLKNPTMSRWGLFGCGVISILAFVFCLYWAAQVRDHKKLNQVKFDLLNEMAPLLHFGDATVEQAGVRSYQPFDREWKILDSKGSLPAKTLKLLKGSRFEFYLPLAFQIVFLILTALIVAMVFRVAEPKNETTQPAASSPPPTLPVVAPTTTTGQK